MLGVVNSADLGPGVETDSLLVIGPMLADVYFGGDFLREAMTPSSHNATPVHPPQASGRQQPR